MPPCRSQICILLVSSEGLKLVLEWWLRGSPHVLYVSVGDWKVEIMKSRIPVLWISLGKVEGPSSLGKNTNLLEKDGLLRKVLGAGAPSPELCFEEQWPRSWYRAALMRKRYQETPRGYSCCTGNSRHIAGNSMGTSAESTPATGADRTLCQILASPKVSHLRHSPHQQNITLLWAGLLIFPEDLCAVCLLWWKPDCNSVS